MTEIDSSAGGAKSRVEITADPLIALEIGAQIVFETILFDFDNGNKSPMPLIDTSFIQGVILAIGIANREGSQIIGSAIMIGPGLAVTAKHILEEWVPNLESQKNELFLIGPRGVEMDFWKVSSINYSHENDVCYLSLELRSSLPESFTLSKAPLRIKLPLIGEKLYIVGFRFEDHVLHQDGSKPNPTFSGGLYISSGHVTQVFPYGRDSSMLPGPCVEIDCGSLGGMSGGPIFDSEGNLVAVLSTSLEDGENNSPSFGSWVASTLDRAVNLSWPPGVSPQQVRLIDMDPRLLAIPDRERLTLFVEGDVSHIRIRNEE